MTTQDDNFLAATSDDQGPWGSGFSCDGPLYDIGLMGTGTRLTGVFGWGGVGEGPDVRDIRSPLAGVVGTCRDGPGVRGTSFNNVGVYGQTEGLGAVPRLLAGVYGAATVQPGAIGYSRTGDGVQGLSFTGTGIRAVSFFGPGLDSLSGALTGVRGVSAGLGPNPGHNLPTIAGVLGTSDAQAGVIGTSNRTAGVLGFSNNVGVYGEGRQLCGDIQGQRVDHRRPDPAGRYRGGQDQECDRAVP